MPALMVRNRHSRYVGVIFENEAIGALLENLFTSCARSYGKQVDAATLSSAVAHEKDAAIIMVSFDGRLSKVPRETMLKDAVAGVRWLRQSSAPTFKDLRRVSRKWSEVIGCMLGIQVIAEEKLVSFIDRMEMAFKIRGL
ncbi:hypothetical protein M413DRAFT_31718 [Hebeloma cylindrosporum]|uniref:Uncharacterized protein n=1 Tax=Hebeloma cylindrosporum TaxID=76867 RepID=A0A0C3BWN9_HEBCY|nr:hypothetical protein M413DRAFT_31718 [Hebeloma cylindrosporum h7]